MSQSIPFLLSQAIVQALGAAPALAGAKVHDNPADPAALADGARLVFVEDKADAPINQPGQAMGRTFTITVGVINRSAADRSGADEDMEFAKAVVQATAMATCKALQADRRVVSFAPPREGARGYRVEGLDVGGALIHTSFEIDYRTPAVR